MFGPPNSTMTVEAIISDKSEKAFDHTSHVGVKENFTMLISQVRDSGSGLRFRIWIKETK